MHTLRFVRKLKGVASPHQFLVRMLCLPSSRSEVNMLPNQLLSPSDTATSEEPSFIVRINRSATNPTIKDVVPTIAQFAYALSSEPHWFNFGIFLQVPIAELKQLELQYSSMGIQRCLIELYNSLESLNKVPTWIDLSKALRMSNHITLANEIYTKYVLRPAQKPSSLSSQRSSKGISVSDKEELIDIIVPSVDVPKTITQEFKQLSQQFSVLATNTIDAIKRSNVDVNNLQQLLFHQYEIAPGLPSADATIDNIFIQLRSRYCLLNYYILKFVSETFLKEYSSPLKMQFSNYESRLDAFKYSTRMKKLMRLLKKTQSTLPSGCKVIKLNVREFWDDVTLESFEAVIKKIMLIVYRYGSQIVVGNYAINSNLLTGSKKDTSDTSDTSDISDVSDIDFDNTTVNIGKSKKYIYLYSGTVIFFVNLHRC